MCFYFASYDVTRNSDCPVLCGKGEIKKIQNFNFNDKKQKTPSIHNNTKDYSLEMHIPMIHLPQLVCLVNHDKELKPHTFSQNEPTVQLFE